MRTWWLWKGGKNEERGQGAQGTFVSNLRTGGIFSLSGHLPTPCRALLGYVYPAIFLSFPHKLSLMHPQLSDKKSGMFTALINHGPSSVNLIVQYAKNSSTRLKSAMPAGGPSSSEPAMGRRTRSITVCGPRYIRQLSAFSCN